MNSKVLLRKSDFSISVNFMLIVPMTTCMWFHIKAKLYRYECLLLHHSYGSYATTSISLLVKFAVKISIKLKLSTVYEDFRILSENERRFTKNIR